MSVTLTDSNGRLKTGMRADILRASLETKNVLSEMGAIYIGTGSTIPILSTDGQINIRKTSFVPRGGNSDNVLTFNNTGVPSLAYQKIGPDTVIEQENYDIKVDETEETLLADYAEEADYVTWATAPSGRNPISIEARLSDLNPKSTSMGALMNLSYNGNVVGEVQLRRGAQIGNYKQVLLYLELSDSANLYSFYRNGGTVTGRLWTGSGTQDFPASITGIFPSGVITTSQASFQQSLALEYTILNNGTISITCPHPFPLGISSLDVTSVLINLYFRMPDAN